MTKSKLNLVIDALLLLCVAAIAGIGLLMKYVLVPGYQRWEIYNRNVELFFLGLTRHDWGAIHFIIGLTFLGLLILHVVLHWGMVVGTYSKLIPSRLLRWVIAVILIFLTILLFVFPYFVEPEIQERGPEKGRGYSERGNSRTHRNLRPDGLLTKREMRTAERAERIHSTADDKAGKILKMVKEHKARTAETLGIDPKIVRAKLKRYGMEQKQLGQFSQHLGQNAPCRARFE